MILPPEGLKVGSLQLLEVAGVVKLCMSMDGKT